jgi:hypothetical protein
LYKLPIPTSTQVVPRQVMAFEQSTYLTTPTDPVHFNPGLIMNVDVNENIDSEEIRIQGSRKIYSNIKMGREATLSLEYALLNTTLLRYGTQDPNGTGTIAKGLEIILSQKLDDVEHIRAARGALTDSVSISLERMPRVTQNFYVPDLTKWMSVSEYNTYLGLTGTQTPQFAAPLTGDPWSNLTGSNGSATTITVDGTPVDVARVTINVNNNILKQKPLGYENPIYACPGNKAITVSIEPFLYDNTFRDLVADYDSVEIVCTLKADTPDVNVTLSGCQFNSNSYTANTGSNDFIVSPLSGTCVDIDVDNSEE